MQQEQMLQDWRFHLGDAADAWNRGYDDGAWQPVVVPHDWSVMHPFSRECSSGTGYLPGGTSWYRAHFALAPIPEGSRVVVTFDGVYKNSQVWCNSYYLGKRPSGYASFAYDISDFVDAEGDNVLSVKVSHEDIADSRWFTGSGIYRRVTIAVLPPVYMPADSLVFDSRPLAHGAASARITAQVKNTTSAHVQMAISASLTDERGEEYALPPERVSLPPGEATGVQMERVLSAPLLWSPDRPSLYVLRVRLMGAGMDQQIERKVGIRSFRFDAEKGFFLNERPMKIQGVCVHHDAGCLGAAVWPAVWQRRLEKLKAMGCNAIRMAHNPHMAELYDLCDAMGFLVMDEAFDEWEGAKNKWHMGHNVYPPKHQGYFEDFHAWHEADLASMVVRGRNHPSIIMWSIGNEIDYPNDPYGHPLFAQMEGNNDKDKPRQEMEYSPNKPNMRRLAVLSRQLAQIVKRHDETRPVLVASAFPELSAQLGFLDGLDMAGYNYKEHLYRSHHEKRPQLPLIGSENGHAFAAWRAVTDNDFISGQFLWTGIDYLGESRGQWPTHGTSSGVLTTAGFEKAEYFRRQALWSGEPVLWLGTRAADGALVPVWHAPQGERVEVVCYTNLADVSLFVNGARCAEAAEDKGGDGILWNVPFEEGMLMATGTDRQGNVHTAQLRTPADDIRITLKPWAPARTLLAQMGEYVLHQIEVTMTDGQGIPAMADEDRLHVQLEGEGMLLGIDNGNLSDDTPMQAPSKRAHHGRAIVYLLKKQCAAETKLSLHWRHQSAALML